MSEPWRCAECRAQVAPGAPRCPECPSTRFEKPEADMGTKISRDGTVSDSASILGMPEMPATPGQGAELEEQEHPGTGEPMTGVEAPADGSTVTISNEAPEGTPEPEQVTQEPSVPPSAPPRRVPPGGGNG